MKEGCWASRRCQHARYLHERNHILSLSRKPYNNNNDTGKKTPKALDQGVAAIKSFYILGGWPIHFYCPPFFFSFSNANPIRFLEPPIHYLFIQVPFPASQWDKRAIPREPSSLHREPSET